MVRGYNVMRGYFEEPAETQEALRDGWLHTGDIGVLDERGYLRITDRKKDMYIVGGFNAYPAEIENVLSMHDDIAQAAVIGAPDERLGEVGVAFVVPRMGANPSATRSSPGPASEWPTTRSRAGSKSSTRCRSAPAAKS